MEDNRLAQRLRMARAYRGWTQTALSRRADVHKMQISKLERGIIQETSTGTLRALSLALGVSPAYLLGLSDDMGVSDVPEKPAREEPAPAKRQWTRKTAPAD